jgi:hypothetical protein
MTLITTFSNMIIYGMFASMIVAVTVSAIVNKIFNLN